jgi:NAD-dependent deacetylase
LKSKLATANHFLFITGAGLGVASGLKTFRGNDGYYNGLNFENLASRSGFDIHPETTWEWYNERFEHYCNAKPNDGHRAIVGFENIQNITTTVATQNVDGLQLRAGSKDRNVYELHGNLRAIKCTGCKYMEAMFQSFDIDRLNHTCGIGKLRPNVVWFGESLSEWSVKKSQIAAMDADIIVVAGTSSRVYPVAGLIDNRASNATVIEINPNPSIAHKVDFVIAEGTETGLPKLLELTRQTKI